MNVTSTEQAGAGVQVTQPILQTKAKFRATDNPASSFVQAAEPGPRHIGYGLPCSKCGTYYMADLSVCPICKCAERISPTTLRAPAGLQNAQSLLDTEEPEEEREPFSKEFKSQLFSAHLRINTAANFRCTLEENHEGGHEPATICRPCYDHLQERANLMEAALHIDLKEAAQIVYDAVWSDESDPSKTYQNAAQALLTELRKRSGINMSSFGKPLSLTTHVTKIILHLRYRQTHYLFLALQVQCQLRTTDLGGARRPPAFPRCD